jgi:hypothetical protein
VQRLPQLPRLLQLILQPLHAHIPPRLCARWTLRHPPFYTGLNKLLETQKFAEFAEAPSKQFYARRMGRPSLTPGICFRPLFGAREK